MWTKTVRACPQRSTPNRRRTLIRLLEELKVKMAAAKKRSQAIIFAEADIRQGKTDIIALKRNNGSTQLLAKAL